MTKNEMIAAYDALRGVKGISGTRVNYAIARSVEAMRQEIAAIQKGMEASEQYQAYEKQRVILCETHAEKDGNGKPAIDGNAYRGLEGNAKFEEELESLRKDFADAIAEREAQAKDFGDFLKTDSDAVLHKVKIADLPDNLTTEQMAAIMPIVED
jgi:hypothetical protein